MKQARVAVVIVTYNSAAEIVTCLDALTTFDDLEIVVVDNASSDCTRAEIEKREGERRNIRLIANRRNLGFAAAVNQGVRATMAPLALLLNPDAHLLRGVDALASRFSNPAVGAAGGLLVSADGAPQAGFFARRLPTPAALIFEALGVNRIWPHNPVNRNYRCLDLDPMIAQDVDQPAGAFLMFRRTAWEGLGGFDERFWPIWFEDVDFCARLRLAGWNVCYEPNAVAVHAGGHSIRALDLEKRQRYWYVGLLGYAGKHFQPAIYRVVCLAIAAGAIFRAITGFPHGGLRTLAVYSGVCRLALRRFFAVRREGKLLLSDARREIR